MGLPAISPIPTTTVANEGSVRDRETLLKILKAWIAEYKSIPRAVEYNEYRNKCIDIMEDLLEELSDIGVFIIDY